MKAGFKESVTVNVIQKCSLGEVYQEDPTREYMTNLLTFELTYLNSTYTKELHY